MSEHNIPARPLTESELQTETLEHLIRAGTLLEGINQKLGALLHQTEQSTEIQRVSHNLLNEMKKGVA